MAMSVKELSPAEQTLIRQCLVFVLESGELEGEFGTRMGVSEAEARQVLEVWPDVDDAAESIAARAINNAMNEVCHGVHLSDWERWFTASPAEVQAAYARWARGR
jgi:hypothetical protein